MSGDRAQGLVCLQGGGEFSPGCRAMDRQLLDLAPGPVVVTALAGTVGRDYRTATDNGVMHLRALGAREVLAAPDVREDPEGALAALRGARLVVLPGGSPSRLLSALTSTPLGQLLVDLVADGGAVMGASAGAMVLCGWTVLPDQRGPSGMAVSKGLGIVPDALVLPHWNGGSSRADWQRAIEAGTPEGTTVLGLPEESGVLLQDGVLTSVGQRASTLVSEARDLPLAASWRLP